MPEVNIRISKISNDVDFVIDGRVKFYADTFVYENEHYKVLMKGVVYNFKSLDSRVNFEIIVKGFKKYGSGFVNSLRGSFCGAVLNKGNGQCTVFTNQIGDQKLYYAQSSTDILISSNVFTLNRTLRESNVKLSLNEQSAYCLLSYGYLLDNMTMINEIKRLTAGQLLSIADGKLFLESYFKLDNTPNRKIADHEAIEELDKLFRESVSLEYEKDHLYGFKHLSSISGGFDCRMTNWVAKDLGYEEVTTYTFSQYGYLDMTIAQEVASYLGYEWVFKALDHGDFVMNVDQMVELTNAQVIYHGSAHAQSTFRILDFSEYGMLHTGQLGDVTIGTYVPSGAYNRPSSIKATSKHLLNKVSFDFSAYENNELATYSIRGFNGILSGNFVAQAHTEVASPFLDVDFMNFCMSIPAETRAHHHLYKKWVLEKYPIAAQFKWESINAKITSKTINVRGKIIPIKQLPKFVKDGIMYKLGRPINGTYSKHSMNPFDYWLKNNNRLQSYIDTYFSKHIDLVSHKSLKEDCIELFERGSAIEKMQVLTVLSAIKQLGL